jgi:hypothetical protein
MNSRGEHEGNRQNHYVREYRVFRFDRGDYRGLITNAHMLRVRRPGISHAL